MNRIVAVVMLCLISLPAALWAGSSSPSLPKSYHSWQKSGRKVVTDKSSLFYGIHYIYADKKAMNGYKAGNRFAEGSSIVIEHFNIKDGSGSPAEGSKNMVVLMRKDKRMKTTGGWLFAGYGADGAPSGLDPVSTCFGCHQKDAAKKDYVISTINDFKK
ncbi:cytochrome P460 family protein [Oryzomonas sagensis]|uniref:Cytochrome P460 family protein n=1 Tax=Oryzomonas sagensis TaxID=2603857 RepID=A0ABQ6TLT6_9BACT|nr:cytochrome P460 family protein [Oryzomonas sagensis]KAB0669409.1 cytochrome P460 family protein [Oryzomonas sagensis]